MGKIVKGGGEVGTVVTGEVEVGTMVAGAVSFPPLHETVISRTIITSGRLKTVFTH
jgi:hypothetical protein